MSYATFTVEQHLGPFDNCHPLHVADYAGVYFLCLGTRQLAKAAKSAHVSQSVYVMQVLQAHFKHKKDITE